MLKLALFIIALFPICLIAQDNSKLPVGSYIQERKDNYLYDKYEPITLSIALEKALRANNQEKLRKIESNILDLGWKDSYTSFWFPTVDLTLSSGSQYVGRLRRGSKDRTSLSSTPTGTLGIEINDYTIFNWGKDHLQYLNDRDNYLRQKTALSEQRRDLKHDTMIKYFEVLYWQKVEEIYKEYLRHSSFVYRLNRERLAQKKVTKEDFLRSRSLYLKSQNEYQDIQIARQVSEEELSYMLNDPIGTRYVSEEILEYKPLKLAIDEAITLAENNNPDILESKNLVSTSSRDYQHTQRENLPLPKLSVNLGAYKKVYGPNTNRTLYETESNSSDVEISASVNATWSLFGEGGFLNKRKTTSALLRKNYAYKDKEFSQRKAGASIRTNFKRILYFQRQMKVIDSRIPTIRSTFDQTLENYMKRRNNFNDFEIVLTDLTESESLLEKTRFSHMREKILLAKNIGLDDFPGENFDRLAVKKEPK